MNNPFFQQPENAYGRTKDHGAKGTDSRMMQMMEAGNSLLKAFMAIIGEPENLDSFVKGASTLPEVLMNLSRQMLEGTLEMQKNMLERAQRIGQETKAYTFEDIDQEFFQKFRQIYEKEFRKYFHIPQLGLTRFYQEKIGDAMDKYNIYQNSLAEFMYMFYIPVEKSSLVMQEKLQDLMEKGEIPTNYRDFYSMWVKILEGHYMTLLQSPEYTRVLDNTISTLAQYKQAKDEVIADLLRQVPVPTNQEMDELYKDFYLMKKKIKAMSGKIEDLEEALVQATQNAAMEEDHDTIEN